jgi:hypothetical protein
VLLLSWNPEKCGFGQFSLKRDMKCATCHDQMSIFQPEVARVVFDIISNHEFDEESLKIPVFFTSSIVAA